MKRLIIILSILFWCCNTNAMELLVKVGSQYPSELSSKHGTGWRDGEIADIRPSGFHHRRANNCIIDFPNIDFWILRGSTDWKSSKDSVMDLKKYISKADSTGKYKWEAGYGKEDVLASKRDYYIDFQDLLDKGHITKAQYDGIYSDIPHPPISFPDLSIDGKLKEERTDTRLNEK